VPDAVTVVPVGLLAIQSSVTQSDSGAEETEMNRHGISIVCACGTWCLRVL